MTTISDRFDLEDAELRVAPDHNLEAVVLSVEAADLELVLPARSAIDTILRMVGALSRVQQALLMPVNQLTSGQHALAAGSRSEGGDDHGAASMERSRRCGSSCRDRGVRRAVCSGLGIGSGCVSAFTPGRWWLA